MLPLEWIGLRPTGLRFVPDWLGPEDHPWIEALLDELRRFEGRRTREWQQRALEPLRAETNERRRRLAVATLKELCERAPGRVDHRPGALREALFDAAHQGRAAGSTREQILDSLSTQLNITPAALLKSLYADLPTERPLRLPAPVPDPPALVRHTNQHIARSLIRSASQIEIRLASRSRPLIRQILLRRLLATVHPHGAGARIEVSGPFALFRHTTVYGRALASLLPVLRGADGFELLARCTLGSRPVMARLGSGDPIFPPGAEPRRFDSKLEERFARDFAKLAPDWDLVREPEPITVGGAWIFPDFALVHRASRRRWLMEIVGYWTPAYLEAKLDRLRRAGRQDLIVAVDEKLACDDKEIPELPQMVRFRGRVDAAAILAILAILERAVRPPALTPTAKRLIQPGDLFLDYAGRRPVSDPIHARLAQLKPGDAVCLRVEGGAVRIVHSSGLPVATLSAAARAQWTPILDRVQSATVLAMRDRGRDESHPDWRHQLQVERWRVPVVEVLLAAPLPCPPPGAPSPRAPG